MSGTHFWHRTAWRESATSPRRSRRPGASSRRRHIHCGASCASIPGIRLSCEISPCSLWPSHPGSCLRRSPSTSWRASGCESLADRPTVWCWRGQSGQGGAADSQRPRGRCRTTALSTARLCFLRGGARTGLDCKLPSSFCGAVALGLVVSNLVSGTPREFVLGLTVSNLVLGGRCSGNYGFKAVLRGYRPLYTF